MDLRKWLAIASTSVGQKAGREKKCELPQKTDKNYVDNKLVVWYYIKVGGRNTANK